MKPIRAIRAVPIVVSAFLAVSCEKGPSDYVSQAIDAYADCADTSGEAAIEGCAQAVDAIDGLQSRGSAASQFDSEFVWFIRSGAEMNLGGGYFDVDGTRSARACEQFEHAWVSFGNSSRQAIGDENYVDSDQNISELVRLCRNDYPAPDWGRALPHDKPAQ